MKKTIIILTIVFGVIFLASCQNDTGEANLNTYFYDRVDNQWYEEQKVLRVGMDLRYPPFETIDDNASPMGISVDVARAFGAYIGRRVEIVDTNFGSLIPALDAGDIDIIIASMSITEERAQSVDFSNPYFYFKIISLVNKSFADANGLDEDSTTEELLAIEDVDYTGIIGQISASIPESLGKEVSIAPDLGIAVESVAQGGADVLLMSANPVTDGYRANSNTTIVLWDPFVSSPIGMAVKKGNNTLLDHANAYIESMQSSEFYSLLSDNWDEVLLEKLVRYGLEFYINE